MYKVEQNKIKANIASDYSRIQTQLDDYYAGRSHLSPEKVNLLKTELADMRTNDIKQALKRTDWDVGKIELVEPKEHFFENINLSKNDGISLHEYFNSRYGENFVNESFELDSAKGRI